ncbi:MAG TPA: hypothetical protein ENL07_11555 [Chlorobaculum parvum]|uniref:Methyltransferase type 11 domain-containing protein n=1 Tax=Chlorobaculum parvum TaxID=274539 RepID=A0A7C5DFU0_9CHLB|nr:hypothetical protein [Chlorobaculum parvum]
MFIEDSVDLVIANLVLEFIEIERFIGQAQLVSPVGTVVSVIFQVVHAAPFISGSGIAAIGSLSRFKQEVDQADFEQRMTGRGFSVVTKRRHLLHDSKELVRLDFRKR